MRLRLRLARDEAVNTEYFEPRKNSGAQFL